MTLETNVVLLNLGESITIPKQPVRGGVGRNPHIYIQFTDCRGGNLGDEIYLGRCVQGVTLDPAVLLNALAFVIFPWATAPTAADRGLPLAAASNSPASVRTSSSVTT